MFPYQLMLLEWTFQGFFGHMPLSQNKKLHNLENFLHFAKNTKMAHKI